MKILTAYKPGALYRQEHIERLREQVKKYSGKSLIVVEGRHPHWWCKMDIFSMEGPCLYFDLDTTVVGDISPLMDEVHRNEFIGLRDFNFPDRFASGVMGWSGDVSYLMEEFDKDANHLMYSHTGGDQDYISEAYVGNMSYWQDLLPNHIQSYKKDVRRNTIHPDCRVVAFHGRPKPWDLPELIKE